MDVYELLTLLIDKGVKLNVVDNQIKISAEQGVITPELLNLIKSNKQALIQIVQKKTEVTIPRAPEQDHYQLSSAQQRLYFLFQLDKDSAAYNIPKVVRLQGLVDLDHLQATFQQLINRHEILRTQFVEIDEVPVQRISSEVNFELERFQSTEATIPETVAQFIRPFDLNNELLIRGGVIHVSPENNKEEAYHVLMVDVHHIISDGVSQNILIEEFTKLFQGEELPATGLQYKDYAEWQQSPEQQATLAQDKDYWLDLYAEEASQLNLPQDYARPLTREFEGDVVSLSLDAQVSGQLKAICEEEGTTMFMVLLSVYSILLSKLSNQADVVIGTPVAGRQHADLDRMIGMFVNTLPLRNRPEGHKTFRNYVREVHAQTLNSFDHQGFQYEDLIDELKMPRDTSRNPLFDVMYSHQNLETSSLALPGIQATALNSGQVTSKFDMSLTTVEMEGHIVLNFQYVKSLFDRATIERFATFFERIVSLLLAQPDGQLSDIDYIPEEERKLILEEFNDTKVEFPEDKTILDRLEEQVALTPDKEALVYEGETLTYQEFSARVDQIAQVLQAKSIGSGSAVGLLLDRSFELIISIYGILKAGASYVPVDSQFPQDRIDYIFEDSQVSHVLTVKQFGSLVKNGIEQIHIDNLSANNREGAIQNQSTPQGLAYTIYTSGSTGKPKGVGVRHESLTNLLYSLQRQYPLVGADKFLLKTNHVFDVSISEIFGWVLGGGSLVILPQEAKADADKMLSLIGAHQVTHLNFVPSMFSLFLDTLEIHGTTALNSLRYIFLAGEALPPSQVKRFADLDTQVRLANIYGPTETTVYSSSYSVDPATIGETVPIGKPMENVKMLVLNESQLLQPVGVPGELYIGGKCLSAGYLHNPEQTAAKFIPNPYAEGELMYRAGDLARWLPDGNLEFLGRIDDQVKIRGYRIELGEIAARIAEHEAIKDALVLVKGDVSDPYLVGYYVADQAIEEAQIKEYLSTQLPEYMVPSHFVHLTALPLTANGKVDRRALPEVSIDASTNFVPATTELEVKLVDIWAEVLKLSSDQISVARGFFELGGHSLRATVMVNKIRKELELEIPLRDVFRYQDIRSLAKHLSGLQNSEFTAIPVAEARSSYPLSSAQNRLYFLYQLDKSSLAYNMPYVVKLEGELDKERLKTSFQQLVDRHESLRTRFAEQEEGPVQIIQDSVDFKINFDTCPASKIRNKVDAFIRPFDLFEGNLIRVGLIALEDEPEAHILLVDIHHIITDGVSQGILIRDFVSLYQAETLAPLRLQYKDFATWQQSVDQQDELVQDKDFWLDIYSEEVTQLNLPLDHARPLITDHVGATASLSLDKAVTGHLKAICEEEGTTMYMLLLSIYSVLLAKLSNQSDIVIGTPVAGREHAELDGMIGMFVNTLPLRNRPEGEKSFQNFLKEVHDQTLQSFDHQGYQYEDLIDELKVPRDTSRNPLFDVMFTHQTLEASSLSLPGLEVSTLGSGKVTSKFDLSLFTREAEDQLSLHLQYATELFELSTIERFLSYFESIVKGIVSNKFITINELSLISERESEQLLQLGVAESAADALQKNIVEVFHQQVATYPNHPALSGIGEEFTYQELNEAANQLAHELLRKGVSEQGVVGIIFDRSPEMIISILAILKVGAVYLPISPEAPEERIRYMLEDSGAQRLLVQKASFDKTYDVATLIYQDLELSNNPNENPVSSLALKPDSLAYIIYTSGTTGKPKGTPIPHRGMTGLVLDAQYVDFQPEDRVLQLSNYIFDGSVFDIFGALLNGACLVQIDDRKSKDVHEIAAHIRNESVTNGLITTALFNVLVDEDVDALSGMRKLYFGGERASTDHVNRAFHHLGPDVLVQAYGPTEGSVCATYYPIQELQPAELSVPIGWPASHSHLTILDKAQQLVPQGVAGELCIAGERLSPGYLNRPELNAEKFIANPYGDGKLYRTGDLARWLPDGTIEFLGRIDDQVKIRGYRIELGEIANRINAHEAIKEALVIVKGEAADQYLVGYYVSDTPIEEIELKEYLSQQLPDYMVPGHFVHLEFLPLTANGKVDKRALPEITIRESENHEPAATELESELVDIWSDVLKLEADQVSVTRSFFELGGHSLRATVMVNKLKKALEVEVPLRDVFRHQDIRSLAQHISGLQKSNFNTIPVAEPNESYPLSSAQSRMYFLNQLDKTSLAYNMPYVVRLEGELDVEQLASSFQQLVERHESLRTSFVEQEEGPVQVIQEAVDFEINRYICQTIGIQDQVDAFVRPFDLGEGPLLRVGLIALADEPGAYILLVDMHHIITDGISQGVLIRDLVSLYKAEALAPMRLQYKDFATWQQAADQQEALAQDKDFWLDTYSEEVTQLNLPLDHTRPLIKDHEGDVVSFNLNTDLSAQLKSFCEAEGTTMYMVLLSIYSVLLSKLSNQSDIVIGTPVAGRQHADLEGMIGMFVNTLPLRNHPEGNKGFRQFLKEVHEQTLNSFDHQSYQYEDLIDELNVPRDTSRNPLFDVIFTHQTLEVASLSLPGVKASSLNRGQITAKFDLSLTTVEAEGQVSLHLQYAKSLFERNTIERFATYFERIAEWLLDNPDDAINTVDYIPVAERELILEDFNDTKVVFPEDQTILDRLAEQVRLTPDKEALIFDGETLSYQEFSDRIDEIAHSLQSNGIQAGTAVGLLLDRSFELIISIYGILKSGASYVPVDSQFPQDRIDYIFEDSQVSHVLTVKQYGNRVKKDLEQIHIDKLTSADTKLQVENLSVPQGLAYTIYTSGSTGKPKGVGVQHSAVTNLMHSLQRQYPLISEDKFLLKTNHVFDVSIPEIFGWVLGGGSLVILPQEAKADTEQMLSLIGEHQVTHLNFVPSMFSLFLDTLEINGVNALDSLKYIFLAGETFHASQAKRFVELGTGVQLKNFYGPTETTVYCSYFDIEPDNIGESLPIGKPMENATMLVLNEKQLIQPVGVPGELYIGGKCLSVGYLHNPEQTAAKFIPNPYAEGELLYKAGDLARWLPDGNLEFLGRIDDQVKIRGYRIELGEIANQINSHEAIKEALVLLKGETTDQYLVGYYVSETQIEEIALKEYLTQQLPDYMVPGHFVHLTSLPLTANGKVDKRALPEITIAASDNYVAADTELEAQMVNIWSDVLKLEADQISVARSFFELGGHSLRATVMVNKLKKTLEVDVPLRDVFRYQDIRSLAQHIAGLQKSGFTTIPVAGPRESYPLSSAQSRLYFLYQLDKTSLAYNMPYVVKLEGELDTEQLANSFQQLVDRHESLRTSFIEQEDGPVQVIQESVDFEISRYTCEASAVQDQVDAFVRPFDLNEGPLFRVGLIELKDEPGVHILLVDMHHIITDGVSQGVLIRDLVALYKAETLAPLRLQYKDFATWQQADEQQDILAQDKDFWLDIYTEEVTQLNLPLDRTRPLIKDHEGDVVSLHLNAELSAELKAFCEAEGTTMYMVLLSIYSVLLSKLSNQSDIVIGTPVAGRQHADLEGMIGMFVNTLPLRNHPEGNKAFRPFLKEVHEQTLNSFDHQSYQYEDLIDELNVPRDTSRNPLFDVMYTHQTLEVASLSLPGVQASSLNRGQITAKFDLSLTTVEAEGQVSLHLQYAKSLFDRTTIERFTTFFARIAELLMANPDRAINTIDYIPSAERQLILEDFNDTQIEFPEDKTILDRLEEQVALTPDKEALIFSGESLSYQAFSDRVNAVSHLLKSEGINSESVVGILLDRSFDLIIAVYGILKAGASYVPVDSQFPQDRIDYIFEDSQVSHVLTVEQYGGLVAEGIAQIHIDTLPENTILGAFDNQSVPQGLAYTIYTSGSTGQPKGVGVRHSSLTNLLYALQRQYPLTPNDKFLLKTNHVFDVSIAEIFGWVLGGGSLVILPQEAKADTEEMLTLISKHQVTHLNFVPSMFSLFLDTLEIKGTDDLSCLRYIILAGEALPPAQVKRFAELKSEVRLENIYGPTEATVYSSSYSVDPTTIGELVPIGKPLENVTMLVLNDKQLLQPVGVPGELYIGGKCLSAGYLHNPEQTAAKFIPNPYAKGELMYRAGDLARWLPDGNLEFLGRIDDQVKIRGYRIELGEISSRIAEHEAIKEALVLVKGEVSDQYLVGYYVAEAPIEENELRDYLSQQLPDYMVPGYFVHLISLPLTANGKVDRKALPVVSIDATADYVAAATNLEAQLVGIWAEVLKLEEDQISVTRSFFELGGHSLRATVMVNKLKKALEVDVQLRNVFRYQDIRSLAQHIAGLQHSGFTTIPVAEPSDSYPLSSAQNRLYFLYQLDHASTAYNMPYVVKLEGALDVDRLATSFQQLVDRHESLRTSFVEGEEGPVQIIQEAVDFQISRYTCNAEGIQEKVDAFIRPFDLSKGPLLSVGLITLEDEPDVHILLVDMHHIITDGVSQGVLIRDFVSLYKSETLAPLRLQYKDFATWQQAAEQQDLLVQDKDFWLELYAEEVSQLSLPWDHARPLVMDHVGAMASLSLDKGTTAQLKTICEEEGTTLYMLLLSIYNVLLSKLSNQSDIVIGTPVAGRQHPDLDGMIGMFVNTLPLRNRPNGEKTFQSFLQEVHDLTLQSFDHQGYQYEDLIDELKIPRDTSRNPLFDVMYTHQTLEASSLSLPGLEAYTLGSGKVTSKFDLSLLTREADDQLTLHLQYATALFEHSTVERFLSYFENVVKQIVSDKTIKIDDLTLISADEAEQLLQLGISQASDQALERNIVEVFHQQVVNHPERPALSGIGDGFTYQELNEAANQLAHELLKQGVTRQGVVGIIFDRSPEMIISIMAILKAGAIYLPISPAAPEERIRYMVEDSGAQWLLVKSKAFDKDYCVTTLVYTDLDLTGNSTENPEVSQSITPDSLAYIIYTSGTTGKPKGTPIPHRGMTGLVLEAEYADFQPEDRVLQLSNYIFDGSVFDIFGALLNGACLVQIDDQKSKDVHEIAAHIRNESVTNGLITTALFNVLVDEDVDALSGMRKLYFGGERASTDHVNRAFKHLGPDVLVQAYGPTEGSVCATYYPIQEALGTDLSVPIGWPASHSHLTILDKTQKLVPQGVAGELCIAGGRLSPGYLNRPELNAEKFIPHPYWEGKLYRTGDLARRLPDGTIEFLGRIDDQVKIRGYRIELGEIETRLTDYSTVKDALVLGKGDKADTYLVAYYVAEEPVTDAALKKHLSAFLPEYMVPGYFVHLSALPLTPNGKVDKRALPEVSVTELDFDPAASDLETKVVDIWSDVLKLDQELISVTKSFFEMGGHSLRAAVMKHKIFRELGVDIPLVDLFITPNVRAIASRIQDMQWSTIQGDERIVLMKKASENAPNLFIFHDGSGDVNGYIELVSLIEGYNCWGLKSTSLDTCAPQNLELPRIVEEYIGRIRTIQPEGTYHLMGWSTGGLLAYEAGKQLLSAGDTVDQIIAIDSYFDRTRAEDHPALADFSLEHEKALLGDVLNGANPWLEDANSIDELWNEVIDQLKPHLSEVDTFKALIPASFQTLIPNFDQISLTDVVTYFNTIRTLDHVVQNYQPTVELDTHLTYLKASQTEFTSTESILGLAGSKEYHEIEADHFTIMQDPLVKQLAQLIKNSLASKKLEPTV